MQVFIDFEFTDFKERDIISIGLAAENGATFYGENLDFDKRKCSQFVKDIVLPLCDFPKFGKRQSTLAANAFEWLNGLPSDNIQIMIDYMGDWELLGELFNYEKHPKINPLPINLLVPMHVAIANHRNQMLGEVNELEYAKIAEQGKVCYTIEFYNYFRDNGEIQHHALSDAKANLRGFNAMMSHVTKLLK